MALPWHTSVSILVAGGLMAGAIYLSLRPSASSEPPGGAAKEPAARPAELTSSPMAERDRRRWDDEPEPPRSVGSRGQEPVGEPEPANPVALPLGASSTPQELTERIQQDAGEAFEGIRKRVRSDCWDKLPDDPEAPDEVNLRLSLSYGADGKVLLSGISEPPEGSRDGLASCLGPLIHSLDVPAPGSNLSVELQVTVP